jgi:enoyl-CoA hydratase
MLCNNRQYVIAAVATGQAMSELIVDRDGAIATVTMNRPAAMNALSKSLRRALAEAIADLDADAAVRVVILTGAGERAFTAGLDLKELGSAPDALDAATAVSALVNPVKAIESCRKPVIGAINGVAITGGFELALACDILIASSHARFADTHVRVGIMPGWGLSQKLSRLIGPYRAKELSLSGNFLDATTAEAWGLVNRVVAPSELMAVTGKLARDIAQGDPRMLHEMKRLIDDGYGLSLGDGLSLETERSSSQNAGVAAGDVEQRRRDVMARGRSQQSGLTK